jgi:Protein of unknown function (DUF4058)
MPLLDHFRPPLHDARHWESFHGTWATAIMRDLNRRVLPQGYFAEAQVQLGGRVEVEVATFERDEPTLAPASGNGGVAVETLAPPATTLLMPAVFPDEIEVQVFGTRTGTTLVAAIELVSPANKDRPESRRAFAIKCASYLQQGIGLIVVDVVTERLANLHDEMVRLLELPDAHRFPTDQPLYTTAYRPLRREGEADQVQLWRVALSVGQPLPTMPLALRGGPTVAVDLETTYAEARLDSRL